METWDITTLDVEPHQPKVLHSDDEGRTIAINLPAGEQLQDHQVHERAWIVILDGQAEVEDSNGGTVTLGAGSLALTAPNERHEVRAVADTLILLVLAPWPGDGHPSQRANA